MTYLDAIQYLNSLNNFEARLHTVGQADFSLDLFQQYCGAAGNPEKDLKCVHIAGSKGKGSTAALTAQMLKCAGYRVGLYTSPHLYDVRERIRILLQDAEASQQTEDLFPDCLSPQEFARWTVYLKDLQDSLKTNPLTYYEFLTLLAFLYFREQEVDMVVLETGLGGRLDATNVVQPFVCAITLIDLEHTHILGDTFEAIAREKSGIIKPGCGGVVSAPQDPAAQRVIRETCAQCGVKFILADDNAGIPEVSLAGDFQKINAAVAIEIARCLRDAGFQIGDEAVRSALDQVFWPARMEIVSREPLVIIDGAHTPAAGRALVETIRQRFPQKNVVVILGMNVDKKKAAVAQHLSVLAQRVILTKSSHDRADESIEMSVGHIFRRQNIPVTWQPVLRDAIDEALALMGKDDMMLVTGSLFVAAQAREILMKRI